MKLDLAEFNQKFEEIIKKEEDYTLNTNLWKEYRTYSQKVIDNLNSIDSLIKFLTPVIEKKSTSSVVSWNAYPKDTPNNMSLLDKYNFPKDFLLFQEIYGKHPIKISVDEGDSFFSLSATDIHNELNNYYSLLPLNGYLILGSDGNSNVYVYDSNDPKSPYKFILHDNGVRSIDSVDEIYGDLGVYFNSQNELINENNLDLTEIIHEGIFLASSKYVREYLEVNEDNEDGMEPLPYLNFIELIKGKIIEGHEYYFEDFDYRFEYNEG